MSPGDPDKLTISTLFLPARNSPTDPLAQRAFLAVKLTGALHLVVTDGDTGAAVKLLRETISERIDQALNEALGRPDETVATVTGAC